MGRRIAVLVHHKDDFRAAKYLLSLIVREWESAGHVILYDANRTPGYTQAGAAPKPESLAAIRDLARGLDWFL